MDRLQSSVITYADIDAAYKSWRLEALVGQDSFEVAQRTLGLSALPTKDQYGLFLAEHHHKAETSEALFSPQGLENLHAVLRFFARQFAQT